MNPLTFIWRWLTLADEREARERHLRRSAASRKAWATRKSNAFKKMLDSTASPVESEEPGPFYETETYI